MAIDGKTLRRSHDGVAGKSAIHMPSAWASVNLLQGVRMEAPRSIRSLRARRLTPYPAL